jgi:signal transduction histidine kinase
MQTNHRIFTNLPDIRRYRLPLIGIASLITLSPLSTAVSNIATRGDGSDLFEFLLFALVALPIVGIIANWSRRQPKVWIKVTSILVSCATAAVFTAIFSQDFSNAYIASLLLILIVVLIYGSRDTLFSVALIVIADGYHFIAHPQAGFVAAFFALLIEITVAIAAWVFVYAANIKRDEAREIAADAQRSDAQTQRLANEVTSLNRTLLGTQNQERKRLARDIHDGPLQSMGVEMLAISRMKRALEASNYDRIAAEVAYLEDIAREVISDLRQTVNALRNTVLDLGIAPALYNLARKTQETTNTEVGVTIDLESDRAIPEAISACIHQLTIEALNNIRKHARAGKVAIRLSCATSDIDNIEEITLTIQDDGQGFDFEESAKRAMKDGHIGLYSMNERAAELGGRMAVTSALGKGTTLSFTFPMIELMPQSGPSTKPLPFLLSA